MESRKLERLSELTAISRKRELTPAEKQEREALRCEYREAVLGSLRADLEQVTIVEPDGTAHEVRPKNGYQHKKTSGEE